MPMAWLRDTASLRAYWMSDSSSALTLRSRCMPIISRIDGAARASRTPTMPIVIIASISVSARGTRACREGFIVASNGLGRG